MNRLLAKDPARRFTSAAEVSRLLGHHLARLQQPSPPAPPTRRRRGRLLAAALGLVLAVLAVATVLRVRTPEGTLVIEVSDPEVTVTVDGSEVIINGAGVREVRLRAGAHQVKATRGGTTVHDELIHITRNGKEVVKVTLEPAGKAAGAARDKGPRTYHTHAGAVRELVFSPDGALMAVAGSKSVHLLEAASGRVRAVFKGFGEGIVSVAFFPDGKTLATVSADGAVKLWDVATGKQLASLKVAAGVRASSMQPQGKILATGVENSVRLWDAATGKELGVWLKHDKPVASVAFSPDGKRLVTRAEGGRVRVWDVDTGKPLGVKVHWQSDTKSLAFSPDGKRLAAAGPRGRVVIWDAATGKEIRALAGWEGPAVVAFRPDGRILGVAADKGVRIWDMRTGKALGTLPGREGTTTKLTFSPDGKRLAAGNTDGVVQVWDLPAGLIGLGKPGVIWRKLGVRLRPAKAENVTRAHPELHGGMMITEVRPDSPAACAGLQRGDILVGLHQWEMLTQENVLYVLTHPDLATFGGLRFYILRGDKINRGTLGRLD